MGRYVKVILFFLLLLIIPVEAIHADPLHELGVEDENKFMVKEELHKLGFYYGNIDDIVEEDLQSSIKLFQEYHGLLDTGIVDDKTAEKLASEIQESYFYGDQDAKILEIQQNLMMLGFGEWDPSDEFESFTEEAVIAFQESHPDLLVTRVLDTKTQAKIKSEIEKKPTHAEVVKESTVDLVDEEIEEPIGIEDESDIEGPAVTKDKSETERTVDVTSVTMAKAEEVLKIGVRSDAVLELQKKLIRLGFGSWTPTTTFGPTTERTLKEFQKYHGLSVNGTLDEATENKLSSEIEKSYFSGDRAAEILEFQNRLIQLGFGNWTPTTRFGPTTEKAIIAFQESHPDLLVTGVLDTKTQAKLKLAKIVLKRGMSSNAVLELQEKLIRLGFGNWTPTTTFGPTTERALKEFQKYHGLYVNGILDEATENKLSSELEESYFSGDRASEILEFQNYLIMLGFGRWTPTTRFGPTTEKAIIAFQESHPDLLVTGVLDTKTQAKLKLETSVLKKGMRSDAVLELQEKLIRLGFGNWTPTTTFGPTTERALKDFQSYYDLNVNGIFDSRTQEKVEEILNSPYQYGKTSNNIRVLQEQLIRLGFGDWKPTTYFGRQTEAAVKSFQEKHGLPVSGIADDKTRAKIAELIDGEKVTKYSISMAKALNLQMQVNPPPQTDKYRNKPAYISSNYVDLGYKGTTKYNVTIRTKPNTNSAVFDRVKPGTEVIILSTVKGGNHNGSTNWYKVRYKGKENYIHSSLVNRTNTKIAIVTAKNLNVQADTNTNSHVYGTFSKDKEVEVIGQKGSWLQVPYNAWRNATRSDTLQYLDPTKNDIFQHLDLSSPVGATAKELNRYLKGKGILEGMGQAFVDAARKHNINELYLISHAILETGHGKSKLAQGIVVNGTKVYNMFGINAYDSCPEKCGSERAFEEGWDTPYKAIVGGAKFIGERYIHNEYKQNTLYKMRWNPAAMEKGKANHQYATDIAWAVKQLTNLKKLHEDLLENPLLKFDIVQYE